MADPSHADVLLKLYELRTESTLRQARAWFMFEFHPTSAQEVLGLLLAPGHESAPYRMVTTYWDMAASLVVQGAIPPELFNAANTEHVMLVAKLRPFLADVRAAARWPDYLGNVERVVGMMPQAEERIATFERYLARQRTLASEGKQRSPHPDAKPATQGSRLGLTGLVALLLLGGCNADGASGGPSLLDSRGTTGSCSSGTSR